MNEKKSLNKCNANTQLILTYLTRAKKYIAADDLYIAMRSTGENIGMATVYKHLKMLRESGVVNVRRAEKKVEYNYL